MSLRSVNEIRMSLSAAPLEALDALVIQFLDDPRAGVQAAVAVARRRLAADEAERTRVFRMMALQSTLHEAGYAVIAGVDEVGRGALAGPVSAAAVVLDVRTHVAGLDDSKRLKPAVRESVAQRVREAAIAISVAHVTPQRIDALGIAAANTLAMRTAIDGLSLSVDHVIADGLAVDLRILSTFVVGGDRQCACVAAASVVAKVDRDALMRELDGDYPGYGLAANKGYGTADHLEAIERIGPSPIHRLSFTPCGQHRLF